jgi:hypothetical protein
VHALLQHQRSSWQLLAEGYRDLEAAKYKSFSFGDFSIRVQFNPARIISSTADISSESIGARPCFLCTVNRPKEQLGIVYGDAYLILSNPYPIFTEHFTIPTVEHVPQRIAGSFGDMLDLARDLGGSSTVLYNGPECGASAPDHLHFQAGKTGFLPIEDEYRTIIHRYGETIDERESFALRAVDDSLRRAIVIESDTKEMILKAFDTLLEALEPYAGSSGEPMLNVLTLFDAPAAAWRVFVFLRRRHRPSAYDAEGDQRIVVSPAAVDYGGVSVLPRRADFEKITREDIIVLFDEVSVGKSVFQDIQYALSRRAPLK